MAELNLIESEHSDEPREEEQADGMMDDTFFSVDDFKWSECFDN